MIITLFWNLAENHFECYKYHSDSIGAINEQFTHLRSIFACDWFEIDCR